MDDEFALFKEENEEIGAASGGSQGAGVPSEKNVEGTEAHENDSSPGEGIKAKVSGSSGGGGRGGNRRPKQSGDSGLSTSKSKASRNQHSGRGGKSKAGGLASRRKTKSATNDAKVAFKAKVTSGS